MKMSEETKIEFQLAKTEISVTTSEYLMDRANSTNTPEARSQELFANSPKHKKMT